MTKLQNVQSLEKLAEDTWETCWEILHTFDNWTLEVGSSLAPSEEGCVSVRQFKGLGKIFKLEVILPYPLDEVFLVQVPGVNSWPRWNPTIISCHTIEEINENTDISYSLSADAVGGLVSRREFVNLRHWKSRDGVMMSSAVAIDHQSQPKSKKYIRGENRPASYVFKNIADQPDKCHFLCFLNTDLKGWMPQFLVDRALGGILMEYLHFLKLHLQARKENHEVETV